MMPHIWRISMNRMITVFCSSSVRPVVSTPVRTTHSRVSRQGNGEAITVAVNYHYSEICSRRPATISHC